MAKRRPPAARTDLPMRLTPLPATRRNYWNDSRAPRYSLSFALPLLILYEVLAAALSSGASGIRNGADVLLKSAFGAVFGPYGAPVLAVVLVGGMIVVIVRDRRRAGTPLRGATFTAMFAESLVMAAVFGVVVGVITAQLVGPLQRVAAGGMDPHLPGIALAAGALDTLGWPTMLMVSLGAGLYEELLFRVLLVGALVWVARKGFGWEATSSALFAVVVGALIFSAFHYVGPYGDRLVLGSFVFRTIAGLAFSGLYVVRGFGITAWTHALYDVMLLVGRGV